MVTPSVQPPPAMWPYPYPPHSGGEKPTAPFVLSLVGGLFILLAGVLEFLVGSYTYNQGFPTINVIGNAGLLVVSGAVGTLLGILIIVLAVLIYQEPRHHTVFGVLIIVFSILSLVSFFGGFFVGFILGLIGGILAVGWKPAPPSAPMPFLLPPPPMSRVCLKCGRFVGLDVRFCPNCGNQLS